MSTFGCSRGSSSHPLQERIEKANPNSKYWKYEADRVLAAVAKKIGYLAYVGFSNTIPNSTTWKETFEMATRKLQELG